MALISDIKRAGVDVSKYCVCIYPATCWVPIDVSDRMGKSNEGGGSRSDSIPGGRAGERVCERAG